MQVTDTNGTIYDPYEWDTCPWPSLLDESSDEFLMWGGEYIDETSNLNPWNGGASPHVCRRLDNGGSDVRACVTPAMASTAYTLLPFVETWQREGLDLQSIGGMKDVYAWWNSEDKYCDSTQSTQPRTQECENNPTLGHCVFCPAQFGITATNAFGVRPGGGAAITARPVDMTEDFFTSGRSIEALVHEYFHVIQRWAGMGPHWNNETTARAVGPMACLYDVPGAETRCVSAGKLNIPGDFDEGRFFGNPRNNMRARTPPICRRHSVTGARTRGWISWGTISKNTGPAPTEDGSS
jgi:hypothetical protein